MTLGSSNILVRNNNSIKPNKRNLVPDISIKNAEEILPSKYINDIYSSDKNSQGNDFQKLEMKANLNLPRSISSKKNIISISLNKKRQDNLPVNIKKATQFYQLMQS